MHSIDGFGKCSDDLYLYACKASQTPESSEENEKKKRKETHIRLIMGCTLAGVDWIGLNTEKWNCINAGNDKNNELNGQRIHIINKDAI